MIAVERHDALTPDIAGLRRTVFMEEQGIAEADEFDGTDGGCTHWLLRVDGHAVATLRTRVADGVVKIGRIATAAEARGRGHAAALIRDAMADARDAGCARAYLSAQVPVIGFYERLGFAAEGPTYDDADIPHRNMWADL